MCESELAGALLLDQWALGWKATQVKRVELKAKDLISSAHHSVPCWSYIIIPCSSLHCDDHLQFLHLRTYWKWKMMVQNSIFLTEGWQSIASSQNKSFVPTIIFCCFSLCEAQLLQLKNWPAATDSIFGWEHWLRMEVLKSFLWVFLLMFLEKQPLNHRRHEIVSFGGRIRTSTFKSLIHFLWCPFIPKQFLVWGFLLKKQTRRSIAENCFQNVIAGRDGSLSTQMFLSPHYVGFHTMIHK